LVRVRDFLVQVARTQLALHRGLALQELRRVEFDVGIGLGSVVRGGRDTDEQGKGKRQEQAWLHTGRSLRVDGTAEWDGATLTSRRAGHVRRGASCPAPGNASASGWNGRSRAARGARPR